MGLRGRAVLPFVFALACSRAPSPDPVSSATLAEPSRHRLEVPVRGLSGLARDGEWLWAVAERGQSLVRVHDDGTQPSLFPITNAPAGHDLESIARTGPGRFAIGTETSAEAWASQEGQAQGRILLVEVRGDSAAVTDQIALPFSIWGMRPQENQGIEGLCATSGMLVAGIETVKTSEGKRLAPLARHPIGGGDWQPFYLQLTSEQGKLSSLECRENGHGVEALAVERHFGVMRVLRFAIPDVADSAIRPDVVADLSAFVEADHLNVEGLAWLDSGVAMIVDNEYKTVTGPNELLLARWLPPGR